MNSEARTSAPELKPLMTELYKKSGAAELDMDLAQFGNILAEVAAKYLPAGRSTAECREFYMGLRTEELVLARACAAGHERAWERFMARYREKLYEIAAYITKESSAARELADSLYGDLYGTTKRDGQRTSKLSSYTGRGSLEGWLRSVLAQEFVNRYRKVRRLVSLEEESEEGAQFAAADVQPVPLVDLRIEQTTDECLAALPQEDRYVLAAYYLDGRKLADVARSLGVHESTISRKLDKLAKSLRKQLLAGLVRRGMSRRQALEALEVDVRDLQVDLRSRLTQESTVSAFQHQKAGAKAGEGR